MSTQLRDLPGGEDRPEVLATILQQLVRGLLGQSGNGIPIAATAHTGTSAANTFSSADTTNGIGIDASSQNSTYRIVVRNTGTFFTGAPTFSAMTQGSVLFAGPSGLLSQDNSNLFWDDTNNRLGIATASPTEKLHVVGNARVSTFLGVGGAPDTTHPLLVTGLAKITSRTGIGGDPDATVMVKVTGDQWITSKLGVGATVDATFVVKVTGTSSLWTTGIAQFDTRVGVGGAADGTAAFKVTGNSIFTGDIVNDTTTFVTDATNNKVGVGALPASTDGMFQVAGYARITSNTAAPTAGEGLELAYNASTNYGIINSVDRSAGTTYGGLIIRSSDLQLTDGTNIRFNTDATGIGFFGATPVAQPTVSGTRTGTLAQLQSVVQDLLNELDTMGLINDTTT